MEWENRGFVGVSQPGKPAAKKRQGHVLTLPLLLFAYANLLLPLFNFEIVDLRSVCSLTGTIPHIKIELIRASAQTLNRQLRISVLLTRRVSAHRNAVHAVSPTLR